MAECTPVLRDVLIVLLCILTAVMLLCLIRAVRGPGTPTGWRPSI